MTRRLSIRIAPLLLLATNLACSNASRPAAPDPTVRVGILHSLSGTMALSERSVVNATLLAIEEINASGGVLGLPIEPVVRDGASDAATFAREAEALILQDQVAVIFGCWTSASRKTVLPVIERHQHLLFYPVQYEGMESSPHIVYTGAAPNQQIIPAVKWAMDRLGNRFFLVGSDYVFPHAAHAIMNDQIRALRGEVVGEAYLPLGSTAVEPVIDAIEQAAPDVILNTLNGDSNIAFFEALRARGITPASIPTISFSITETELNVMQTSLFAGDYAAWNYFQSIPGEANRRFVEAYRNRFGHDAVVTDPMEAAYIGTHLWAKAARLARSTQPAHVRQALGGLSLAAPQGPVSLDPRNQHLWKSVHIGRIREDGQFDLVWSAPKPVRPRPYPPSRTESEWRAFLDHLHQKWDGQWAAPANPEDAP